jgi:hypothetical protein
MTEEFTKKSNNHGWILVFVFCVGMLSLLIFLPSNSKPAVFASKGAGMISKTLLSTSVEEECWTISTSEVSLIDPATAYAVIHDAGCGYDDKTYPLYTKTLEGKTLICFQKFSPSCPNAIVSLYSSKVLK